MANKRKTAGPVMVPLAKQPAQLELFRMVSGEKYTNAVAFYEAIPRFVPARGSAAAIARNPDGTIPPLQRRFTFAGKAFDLMIQPAYVQKGRSRPLARFPGVREELVELVVFKLAVEAGCFAEDLQADKPSPNFTLFTSLYQIHEALKRHGRSGEKSMTYSYDQIREALEVLAKTTFHLTSGDEDLVFSPIADYGYTNGGQDTGGTVFIRFNSLISSAVMARQWRQIDYAGIVQSRLYLVRWLRKMLALRYTQADAANTFNINLSTVIQNSGISLYDRLSDNLKQVRTALDEMSDVVARYVVKPVYGPTVSGKGRQLRDATIVIVPSKAFVTEMILANKQQSLIKDARVAIDGAVLTEPKLADRQAFKTYQDKRDAWLRSSPIRSAPIRSTPLDEPTADI